MSEIHLNECYSVTLCIKILVLDFTEGQSKAKRRARLLKKKNFVVFALAKVVIWFSSRPLKNTSRVDAIVVVQEAWNS